MARVCHLLSRTLQPWCKVPGMAWEGRESPGLLLLPVCPCWGGGGQDPASELLLGLEPRRLGRWDLPGMDTLGKGLLFKCDPAVASPASPVRAEIQLLRGQPCP